MNKIRRFVEWLMIVVTIGFFLRFNADALFVRFTGDEMMNIYRHWEPGTWKMLLANLAFWSKATRPMGALYYLPLFGVFGFNPTPFNVVRLSLLAVSALLFFLLAERVAHSRVVAALATIPVAYHAGMTNLSYDGAFIYDVLCGAFYFGALLYYLHCRGVDGKLRSGQICIFLALYICALNSKEMAVSLPVLVFAYEILNSPRNRILANAWPIFGAIAITIAFIVGKTLGVGALTEMEAYRPVFTWARFFESSIRFLNTIFYTKLFTARLVILLWAFLLGLAVRYRDRRLLLLWIWVIVTPLPIAFIPHREGATLYIVAAGWAMAVAIVGEALARRIALAPIFSRLPAHAVWAGLLCLGVLSYGHETTRRHGFVRDHYVHFGDETWDVIQQFRALPHQPIPKSRVVLINDPFPDSYRTYFIALLSWKDPSLEVWLQSQAHLPENELSQMSYVFDFPGGKLKQVRP